MLSLETCKNSVSNLPWSVDCAFEIKQLPLVVFAATPVGPLPQGLPPVATVVLLAFQVDEADTVDDGCVAPVFDDVFVVFGYEVCGVDFRWDDIEHPLFAWGRRSGRCCRRRRCCRIAIRSVIG